MSAVDLSTGVNEHERESIGVERPEGEQPEQAVPGPMVQPDETPERPTSVANEGSETEIEPHPSRRQPDRPQSLPTRSRGGIGPETGSNGGPVTSRPSEPLAPPRPAPQDDETRADIAREQATRVAWLRAEERDGLLGRPSHGRPELESEGPAVRMDAASWSPWDRETGARDYPAASDPRWRRQRGTSVPTDSDATEEPLELVEGHASGWGRQPVGTGRPLERRIAGPGAAARTQNQGAEWLSDIRRWQDERERAEEEEVRGREDAWGPDDDYLQAAGPSSREGPQRHGHLDLEAERPVEHLRRSKPASSVGGSSNRSRESQSSSQSAREQARQRTLELEVQLAAIRLQAQEHAAREREAVRQQDAADRRERVGDGTLATTRRQAPPDETRAPPPHTAGAQPRRRPDQDGERGARAAAALLAPNTAADQPNLGIGDLGDRSHGNPFAWRGYAPAREAPRSAEQRPPRTEAPSRSPIRENARAETLAHEPGTARVPPLPVRPPPPITAPATEVVRRTERGRQPPPDDVDRRPPAGTRGGPGVHEHRELPFAPPTWSEHEAAARREQRAQEARAVERAHERRKEEGRREVDREQKQREWDRAHDAQVAEQAEQQRHEWVENEKAHARRAADREHQTAERSRKTYVAGGRGPVAGTRPRTKGRTRAATQPRVDRAGSSDGPEPSSRGPRGSIRP